MQLSQFFLQAISDRSHVAQETPVVLSQLRYRRQRGPARERVARKSGAVTQVEVLIIDLGPIKAGPNGHQSAAKRFCQRENIGRHSICLAGEKSAGPSHPGLHLIENEQCTKPAAQLQCGFKIARRRDVNPRLPLDRLNQKSRKIIRSSRQCCFQRCEISERHVPETRCRRAEAALEKLRIGRRHPRQRQAVEALAGREYPEPAGAAACQFDRRFYRFSAAIGEHGMGETRRGDRDQSLCQFPGRWGNRSDDKIRPRLLPDRFQRSPDRLRIVAKRHSAILRNEVSVANSICIEQVTSLSANECLVESKALIQEALVRCDVAHIRRLPL